MNVLLEGSVPVQVAAALPGHRVASIAALGWKGFDNGALLAAAVNGAKPKDCVEVANP
ncbi:MAG TPA: hypothetical protein VHE13_12240 [Opitutus sp.]|nr:hypothetical protein [Opitutus sp.]